MTAREGRQNTNKRSIKEEKELQSQREAVPTSCEDWTAARSLATICGRHPSVRQIQLINEPISVVLLVVRV